VFLLKATILNAETLPLSIRERLHAQKVSVMERDGCVFLSPLREGSGLRGIASRSVLTTNKLRSYRAEDKELDK
jgi:hypothetical protein